MLFLANAISTLRTRDRPEYEVCSNEALERMSFRASSSEPIAGDKDEAISPMFAPWTKAIQIKGCQSERKNGQTVEGRGSLRRMLWELPLGGPF